ncbi:zf-HC2 domain-containing protein [Nocardioides panacisoli]|uniref:zf-HC2 domain-containing protein n=1 Tax=Nocardioides panacisoli TaxID=627624 RepID=UPI001C63602F|nr:zf-HC2 domain-containing protein [Nocardioides panacisoli]QYJ04030.1 zf-HC2 domain-containing protein [Nocardioides panacisoli]
MNEERTHQQVREMLGSYALGHLDGSEVDRVRAHLDGCAACREDLAHIAPLAPLLDQVDPDAFAAPPVPPAVLGDLIRSEVAAERESIEAARHVARVEDELRARRGRRRTGLLVAAALVVAVGVGGVGGGVVGRVTAPEPAAAPLEPIALKRAADGADVEVARADLVDHTWGVELRLVADGFEDGKVFRAAFRTSSGELVPAGEFIGTGPDQLVCNLQSAALREDVVAVVVRDADGAAVLRTSL